MTADWARMPLLSVDTESTGVDPFTARIVEVAAVELDSEGEVRRSWSMIINPGVDIPDEAAAIHGITTERAQAEGVEPEQSLHQIAEMIYDHALAGHAIVMFNARYDLPLLLTEADRHGVDLPAFCPYLDPFLIDRMIDKYRKGSRKLTAMAEHYGVVFDGEAHGAQVDATAAGRVMLALLAAYPELGELSLGSLWMAQVSGHEAWRAGFQEYLRRSDPNAVVTPGWPIPAGAG